MSDGQGPSGESEPSSTVASNRSYDDAEFVDAVREHEPASSNEVANAVGCTFRTAHTRLSRLAEAGRLDRKDFGSMTVWLASE